MNKKIYSIDGKGLYYSFMAGARKVFENQNHLNKINVFPVPDADTGTNFASTMRSIIEMAEPNPDIKVTANSLANAALVGARGNSGIIFAQFLYGFSTEVNKYPSMSISEFASAVKESVKYAYQAITNPVEGTMITVIREWADYIYQIKDSFDDFTSLLESSLEKAREALEKTKLKLQALAKADVVDAGAKAFVVFLEGIIDFFRAGLRILLGSKKAARVEELTNIIHEEITFRYCTEALISGENIDSEQIRKEISLMGDSLVVAGSPTRTRIHIHTDNPSAVFHRLMNHGTITYQKVDDMVFQNNIASGQRPKVAILTDSTCDIPRILRDKYQIHVVPLNVHFGQHYFLDGVTISGKHFKKLFFSSEDFPSTSQPSFQDFVNRYAYLFTQYESVISLHISAAMSGTWNNSRSAAEKMSAEHGKKATVINSAKLSGSLGLMVLRAAQMALEGASHNEIVEAIETWKKRTHMFVTSTTVKYMVRSGRVSPMKGFIANALKIKPVVLVNEEGKSQEGGKAFTEAGTVKIVLGKIRRILEKEKVWNYAITHFNNITTANWYAQEIEKMTGKKPIIFSEISPVLGINAGPGVVSVNLLLE
ncbi:MAG: DAK2 domain-containing protein [Bacteroidales bacterium]